MMSLLSSLRMLVHRVTRAPRRDRPARRNRAASFRPWLELLEDRAVPATVTWKNPAGGAWNVPSNWDTGTLPRAGDDVVIPDLPGNITITHSTGADTIRSLASQETVVLSGGSLTIAGPGPVSRINRDFRVSGGRLDLDGTTLDGSGTLTNAAPLDLFGSTVNVPLVNQGTLFAQRFNWLNGPFTTAPGSRIYIEGDSDELTLRGNARLTVANGFTNNGTIELSESERVEFSIYRPHSAGLVVTNGTLINAPGASITASAPSLGQVGSRYLDAQVVNQGTIQVFADRLTINNNGGTFSNSGTISIASTLSIAAAYTQTAGTLTGAGTLTVAGRLTWSGGTMSGSGQTLANDGLTIDGPAEKVLTQRTLRNAGAGTWTGTGNIRMEAGATFDNLAGSTFDAGNDAIFVSGSGAASAVINAGTFRKSAGTGTTRIDSSITFTNTGTVEVRTGTLSLLGQLTNFGDTTLTGGTYVVSDTLKFAGADIRTNAAVVVLDGPASAVVNQADGNGLANLASNAAGGSFTIQNGRNFTTAAGLAFSNAGTLTVGAGSTFTIAGTFSNFADGTLTGGTYVVGGTLKFAGADIQTNAAALVLDGAASQVVDQAGANGLANFTTNRAAGSFTLQNGRNLTTPGGFTNDGRLTIGAGSTLTVSGNLTNVAGTTFTGGTYVVGGTFKFLNADIRVMAAIVVLDGPASAIVNAAGGNALANLANIPAAGSFTIQNGHNFTTTGGFTNSGSLTVGTGSTFTVTGNLTNFEGTTLTGGSYVLSGTFKFPNADIRVIAATIVLDGSTSAIVNAAGGNALANLANIPAGGSFTIQNGRNFTTAAAVVFTHAGTLNVGAGSTLTVAGRLTWTRGTISGGGQTLASGGLELSGPADKFLTQQTLSNAAGATWTGTGNIVLGGGATFANLVGATFDAQNDAPFIYGAGAAPTITNAGTFRKAAGTGTTRIDPSVTFTNTGTVEVRTGTLFLQGPFTNFKDGRLTDGTYVVKGTLKFAGADIRTNAAHVVLDGAAAKLVNQSDQSALTNLATTAATGSFTLQNGHTFTTAGNFTNEGILAIGAGSTFTVTGNLTNFADRMLRWGTYVVGGTLKFPGADIRTVAAALVLDGPASTVVNQAGENALANLATIPAVGSFTIQNGRNFSTAAAVAFTNGGTLTVGASSTFTVTGSYTQSGGQLTGAGTVTVTGLLTWAGGTMSGSGQTLARGTLTIAGPLTKTLAGRTLSNAGTATWTDRGHLRLGGTFHNDGTLMWTGTGSLFIEDGTFRNAGTATWASTGSLFMTGGTFLNQAGATFEARSDGRVGLVGANTLNNAGTFRKAASTGWTRIDGGVTFTNTGTVEVQTGVLQLEGGGSGRGRFTVAP